MYENVVCCSPLQIRSVICIAEFLDVFKHLLLPLQIDRLAAKLIYAADTSKWTKSVCKMLGQWA